MFAILHSAFFGQAILDEGPGGQRYHKVSGHLSHQTRWIEPFDDHRHYHCPLSRYWSS